MNFLVYTLIFLSLAACKLSNRASSTSAETNSSKSSEQIIAYHGVKVSSKSHKVISDTPITFSSTALSDATLEKKSDLSDYSLRCEKEEVPLPPKWGDRAWQLLGDIDYKKTFASYAPAKLYSYNDQTGVCAAIVRAVGDQIFQFGVICTNLKTGKTCFWDNVDEKGQTLTVTPGFDTKVESTGADKLRENCSECHRGDNPWLVLPGEVTEKLPNPKVRFSPVATQSWSNPEIDKPIKGCSTGGCHNIPKLSFPYCNFALRIIDKGLMPPDGSKDGIEEFRKACKPFQP